MKKNIFVILILVLALVLSVFTGCGEKEPLRICVDIAYTVDYGDYFEPVEEAMDRFLKQFEMAGGSVDNIAVEIIPPRGPEREATLDNLRVEIASGSGPDLFIMNCDIKDSFDTKETLFRMPEKSMELGLFLPLNEYMHDDTQYAEWESMNEVVLAAGRNEEGQQIIPLSYTVPVSVYHKEEGEKCRCDKGGVGCPKNKHQRHAQTIVQLVALDKREPYFHTSVKDPDVSGRILANLRTSQSDYQCQHDNGNHQ